MTDSHKSFLAAAVLSDGRIVTYRSLSRAQKVHVNTAKEMLYGFHQQQNAKKPGSVHATYLLSGVRHPAEASTVSNGDRMDVDEVAPGSSFPGSSIPIQDPKDGEIVTTSIVLAREGDLERVKATFRRINTIHIYSLAPQSLKDLQVLSNVNREVYRDYAKEDPLEVNRQYGTILNPRVKRRKLQGVPAQVASSTVARTSSTADNKTKQAAGTTKPPVAETTKPKTEPETKSKSVKSQAVESAPAKSNSKAPSLKREGSSLFKAFAKSKTKVDREQTNSSVAPSGEPSAAEDEPMKDALEDEQEEDLVVPASSRTKVDRKTPRQSKAQREEELRRMMEADDDDDDDGDERPKEEDPKKTAAESTPPPPPETARSSEAASVETPPPSVPSAATAADEPKQRRRGRRKVMKKVSAKDEEGYLVTKEELVWESFSEEEEPPKAKSMSQPSSTTAGRSSSGAGAGAGAAAAGNSAPAKAKKGQQGRGSIASFFTKK